MDPSVRKLTEDVFLGIFPVKNIVNGCGMCAHKNGSWGRGYYLLLEDEPVTYGIKKSGQAEFAYYTYDVDRDEFIGKNGAALVFDRENEGKTTRDHYRQLIKRSTTGTVIHELGHIVHFTLAGKEPRFSGSVWVPKGFFDLSWTILPNGSRPCMETPSRSRRKPPS